MAKKARAKRPRIKKGTSTKVAAPKSDIAKQQDQAYAKHHKTLPEFVKINLKFRK